MVHGNAVCSSRGQHCFARDDASALTTCFTLPPNQTSRALVLYGMLHNISINPPRSFIQNCINNINSVAHAIEEIASAERNVNNMVHEADRNVGLSNAKNAIS